jgi:hypothetical protein
LQWITFVETGSEGNSTKTPGANECLDKGRPPPIVITSEANLFSLQRELKCIGSGECLSRKATAGNWIPTKCTVDYGAL